MRIALLSLAGLLVGACFDPTRAQGGAAGETDSADTVDGTSSSVGESSSSSAPSLDDTGGTDGASSTTSRGTSSSDGSSDTGEDPYAAWAFHREVWVSSSDLPRVGYQVELQLPRDDPFGPFGRDIRVVDDDGVELPIWFDDPGFGDSASIWVKMDLDSVMDTRLMIHYGFRDAPSVQDANAVFELYDDFDELDPEAWTVDIDEWYVDDEALVTSTDHATSTWSSEAPMIVEARVQWDGGGTEPTIGIAIDSAFGPLGFAGMPVSILYGGGTPEPTGVEPGAWTRVRIEQDEYAQIHFALDGSTLFVWDSAIEAPYRVHLGRIQGDLQPADGVAIDWLFVRQGGARPIVSVGPLMRAVH